MFLVGIVVILRKYKKQTTIALFAIKSEYMAASHCTKEAVSLRQLLLDVKCMQEGPISIMCDNQ